MLSRALNSAEECHLHTLEAEGSIPSTPTKPGRGSSRVRGLSFFRRPGGRARQQGRKYCVRPLVSHADPVTISGAALLYNLHLLRVIAALSVVYFHTTSVAGLNLPYDVGSRGVDVFFVISGFIIAYIGTSKPEQFLRRRLIRVVPFYWAATLCVFALVAVAPRFFRSTNANVPHLLMSLLFVPHESVAGEMHPTLVLGWSLNFEMFFYVTFAAALALAPRRAPLICVGALAAFVAVIHGLHIENAVLGFYARPIVLEFCFGIGVFYLFNWCSERRERLARIGALKGLLVVMLVGALVALYMFEKLYPNTPRYLAAGI